MTINQIKLISIAQALASLLSGCLVVAINYSIGWTISYSFILIEYNYVLYAYILCSLAVLIHIFSSTPLDNDRNRNIGSIVSIVVFTIGAIISLFIFLKSPTLSYVKKCISWELLAQNYVASLASIFYFSSLSLIASASILLIRGKSD